MDKIFSLDSSKDHYGADACVVWCFDDRFYKLLKAFGKEQGWDHIDLVKLAGGARGLASAGAEREFLIDQIKASIRLHSTKRIVLMTHRDCGGYGGSKAFADAGAEAAEHEKQLAAAKQYVVEQLASSDVNRKDSTNTIPVDAYFADFDGLYRVD